MKLRGRKNAKEEKLRVKSASEEIAIFPLAFFSYSHFSHSSQFLPTCIFFFPLANFLTCNFIFHSRKLRKVRVRKNASEKSQKLRFVKIRKLQKLRVGKMLVRKAKNCE